MRMLSGAALGAGVTAFICIFAVAAREASGTTASISTSDLSMAEFIDSLGNGEVERFEAGTAFLCEDGSLPQVPQWNQYQKDDLTGFAGSFGRVKDLAPFIWVGKDQMNRPVISLTAMVSVDWVECDDDGDTWERSSAFSFRSIYDVSGNVGSPVTRRRHYLENRGGQSAGLAYPLGGGAVFADLSAFDPFASGIINGPADEPVIYDTPASLNIAFEPAQYGFTIVFRDACGQGKNLPLVYHRSDCEGASQGWCNERP